MTDKFWYLTKQSLNKKIKSKWFIGINILLAIVVIALININSIIAFFGGDFKEEVKILVVDNTKMSYQVFDDAINDLTKEEDPGKITVKQTQQNEEKLKKKLKDNQIVIVFDNDEEAFVIGGAIIYNLLMPYVKKMYITEIDKEFDGDAFFPRIDETKWKEVSREKGPEDEENDFTYTYVTYEKR